jgi:hypothetical protein
MTRFKRIASALLDHVIITCLCVPVLWLSDGSRFMPFAWVTSFLLYLNKDFLNGRSMTKRLLNMQVVNSSSRIGITRLQCFIRNLTILIWPVEAILLLKNPNRRIGDYLARTECIDLL